MNAKLPPGTLEKLWNDPASWRGLGTYCCKADPRVIVPKRIRWTGWTTNFAHAAAWWYLIVGLLFAIAVICFGAASGRQWLLVGTVAVIVLSIVLGIVLSSPLRFEERD